MSTASEQQPHDYEPSQVRHPMHTETMCEICGHADTYYLHDPDLVEAWLRKTYREGAHHR